MNKIVKASIATTAGIVLLLGGAGTFATWNASTHTDTASIVAGNLVVEAVEGGTWTANGQGIDIATYKVVPGDTLTYTKQMNVRAEGDSLTATLALSDASITPLDPADTADQALAGYLKENAVLAAAGAGITETGASTFTVAPAGGTVNQVVTVTVTIAFPGTAAAGADNDAMNGAVNLNELTVTLTQNIG